MPIAVFGKKVFSVSSGKIYTFDDFQYSSNLDTEKQDSIGKKPSTHNKGPGLNSISFKIPLGINFGSDPRKEVEEWEKIKDEGKAYAFILGKRPLGKYKWLLVDVQMSASAINNAGDILAGEVSLKFDEYVRAGSAASSKSKSLSPGISISNQILDTVEDKSELKRVNPNMPAYITGYAR